MSREYLIGVNATAVGVDDPDQQCYEHYTWVSPRNCTGYCNPEMNKLFDQQSVEPDQMKRKRLVWEVERKLSEDVARGR